MKDFFDTWKFKILIAIAVFLVGIMAYAGANGRLTAAPQELLSVAVAPFQRAAAAVSSGVASLWENYANIDAILEENQIMTVEPGIYLPGVGGVRIEDSVIVKKDGCIPLTSPTRELIIL